MTRDGQDVCCEDVDRRMAELRRLLVEQITCARRGNLPAVEHLSARAQVMVEKIAPCASGRRGAASPRRQDLARLYKELVLILRAEQVNLQGNLKRLRQTRRAVGAYGGRPGRRGGALRVRRVT